ncbi:hypothetical protein DY000_02035885 [Brassica cretica]|uniref:PA domain-containing protein n=1 Tax=Brassica cretica TaxID=69181 RepID=A0ABQ7DF18_BRACR|nr:hypothetical protein DY000_02035885 [Brassica cretica]
MSSFHRCSPVVLLLLLLCFSVAASEDSSPHGCSNKFQTFGASLPSKARQSRRLHASLVDPSDSCYILSSRLDGRIALSFRGNCEFTEKAKHAEAAGACALLVINDKEAAWCKRLLLHSRLVPPAALAMDTYAAFLIFLTRSFVLSGELKGIWVRRFERVWRKWRAKTSFSGTPVYMGLFPEPIVWVL